MTVIGEFLCCSGGIRCRRLDLRIFTFFKECGLLPLVITAPVSESIQTKSAVAPPAKERLVSLDAYRGAIMLLMASSGFGLAQVAREFPESAVWKFLGSQFDHVVWTGCALWDLIQPAFMFMVGVAVPWSIANRRARGESF